MQSATVPLSAVASAARLRLGDDRAEDARARQPEISSEGGVALRFPLRSKVPPRFIRHSTFAKLPASFADS